MGLPAPHLGRRVPALAPNRRPRVTGPCPGGGGGHRRVRLLRTTFDVSETAVEVMRAVIAADMAQFVYRFPFPD